MSYQMTPAERVGTALSHREPDRVPLVLSVTMHGAKELGLSIKDYFSRAENVAEGQLRMLKKYRHDCLLNVYYGAIEVEAWGADVIYRDDCPPNAGAPIIRDVHQIKALVPPSVKDAPCLQKALDSARLLRAAVGDTVPVMGVAIAPFSLPVMQMGFDNYIELIYEQPALFDRLMAINEEFCVAWANAQLAAGCTAIAYVDPIASSGIMPRDVYMRTAFEIARKTIARIDGPTAISFASERCLSLSDVLPETGALAVAVSAFEDLAELKNAYRGRMALIGNLNGITMRNWSADDAEREVRNAIAKAGPGGGFILSDTHGEIPWQVPDETLLAISDAVHTWGRYPLKAGVACGE